MSTSQSLPSTRMRPVEKLAQRENHRSALFWTCSYLLVTTALLYGLFSGWGYDDPFITYRYAANLVGQGEMVYNPGIRVLSTTTPLFTLLLAALSFVWADLPHMANLLGAASLALGGLCLWDLGKTYRTRWTGWAGLLLYPTFPLLVSTLSSETPMYLACILGALAMYARRRWTAAALAAGLAVLARPDGALVPILLAVHFLVERPRALPWKALAAFLAVTVPWFLFAWSYYGSPLPITLAVKQHQGSMAGSQTFLPGFLDLARNHAALWVYRWEAGLAALGLLVLGSRSFRHWWLPLFWTFLYFIAYILLGVSKYNWYYAPLVPGFVVLIGVGLESMGRVIREQPGIPRISSFSSLRVLIPVLLLGLFTWQCIELLRLRGMNDPRLALYGEVGRWLNQYTPEGAKVGTLEIGIIGYYSQRVMIDFAGLIQPEVMKQLRPKSSYADVARWAIERYQPQYLVLHDRLFPEIESGYAVQSCTPAERFSGASYGYDYGLTIYACPP